MPSTETNDAALLIRIAGGDHVALLTLFDRYSSVVAALAQHVLGPGGDADEAVQETFLDVWRHAAAYRPQEGTVRSWVLLRARELAIEALRGSAWVTQASTPRFLPANFAAQGRQPHAAAEDPRFGQERASVQQALAGLSQEQRAMLELGYFDAMPQLDMARQLGRPPLAVGRQFTTIGRDLHGSLHEVRR